MLLSIHADALFEMLVSRPVDIFNSPFSHSRIAISSRILREYEIRFASSPTQQMLFESFMQAVSDRFKALPPAPPALDCSILGDYFFTSRAGGRYLALAREQSLCPIAEAALDGVGVRFGAFPELFESSANSGFKPFESHHLMHGQHNEPAAIGRFFKGEERITVYDKYINAASVALINYALSLASDNCSLAIITSDQAAGFTVAQIRSALVLRASQSAFVDVADRPTLSRVHDRHIFISSDVEMHFTRGVDCFGAPPVWQNEGATIHIYDTSVGRDVSFGFKSPPQGGGARRPIRLKSCVIQ